MNVAQSILNYTNQSLTNYPTDPARTKTIKFDDNVSVATIVPEEHSITKGVSQQIQNSNSKHTARTVRSIFQHLKWIKPKKRRRTTSTHHTTRHDNDASTTHADNVYNNLENDEDTTPQQ